MEMSLVAVVQDSLRVKVQRSRLVHRGSLPLLRFFALATSGHRCRQPRVVLQPPFVVVGDQVPDELLDTLVSLVELERVGQLRAQAKVNVTDR